MEDGVSVANSVEMLHMSPTAYLFVAVLSTVTEAVTEASTNTNEIGWRCAKTVPLEPFEKVTVRPVGSPSASEM